MPRAGEPVHVGRRRGLPGGTPGDPGGATHRSSPREAGARHATSRPDDVRRRCDLLVDRPDQGRRRDAARARRRARCGEDQAPGPDRGADRCRRFAPLPQEEPAADPAPLPQDVHAPIGCSDRSGRRSPTPRRTSRDSICSRSTRSRRPSRGSGACWQSSSWLWPSRRGPRSSRRTTGGRRRASFARRADGGSPALRRTASGRTSPVVQRLGSRSNPQRSTRALETIARARTRSGSR